MTDYCNPKIRAAQKQASRDRDMLAIAESRKTVAEVNHENTAVRLSGERINFAASNSSLW